jgi:hypothetical protein
LGRHGRCWGRQRFRSDQLDLDARLDWRREAAERPDGEQQAEQEMEAERGGKAGFAQDASNGAGALHTQISRLWNGRQAWQAVFPLALLRAEAEQAGEFAAKISVG